MHDEIRKDGGQLRGMEVFGVEFLCVCFEQNRITILGRLGSVFDEFVEGNGEEESVAVGFTLHLILQGQTG